MMFEEDRTKLERAYVAIPAPLKSGMGLALKWCLARSDNSWSKIGLRIPQHRDVERAPILKAIKARGVKVSAETNRGNNDFVSGPLIVYAPSLQSLCLAEDLGMSSAVVVVGASGSRRTEAAETISDFEGIQPWIDAYSPLHLGGGVIEPTKPLVSNPVIWKAMQSFTDSINSSTGLTDPRDESRVIDGLNKLKAAGYILSANELLAAALQLNWRASAAWDLKILTKQINNGVRKRFRETYRSEIVQIWEKEASDLVPSNR